MPKCCVKHLSVHCSSAEVEVTWHARPFDWWVTGGNWHLSVSFPAKNHPRRGWKSISDFLERECQENIHPRRGCFDWIMKPSRCFEFHSFWRVISVFWNEKRSLQCMPKKCVFCWLLRCFTFLFAIIPNAFCFAAATKKLKKWFYVCPS